MAAVAGGGERRRAGRPAGGDSALTRDALIRAAVERFAARGLARTTLRDVADTAGVTQGTLYHHFGSKAELYIVAYVWAVEELYAEFERAVVRKRTLRTRLSAVVDTLTDLQTRFPALFSFILRAWVEHEADDLESLPVPASVGSFLTRLADDAIVRGELAPSDREKFYSVFRATAWGMGVLFLTTPDTTAAADGFKQLFAASLIHDPRP